MSLFRYRLEGNWYKGNTHIHSTASDGGKNFAELAALYSEAGYHFLFRTDHWVASEVGADVEAYPLLWLDGVELDGMDGAGSPYHVVALGSFEGLHREMGLEKALESARAQNGLLVLAHPQWTGNSFEQAVRWNFDGVEVYNHVCRWLNGKGEGGAYWNAMLKRSPGTLALAVDDAHIRPEHPGWNGGWVMVNAPACTPEAILAALRAGNYYSTCGPRFEFIQYDGEQVTLQCSPVQFARLVGPGSLGARTGSFDGQVLTEAAFKIPQNWAYVYLEIEDAQGRRAWSNPLFTQDGDG
jgi:hypothetical protein